MSLSPYCRCICENHAKNEKNHTNPLLRYIKERLAPRYPVIYTTHSPFMIDPDNLLAVRTVEDVVTEKRDILGTKVGDEIWSTDADTIFPLQGALGFDVTQTLFVGKHNLITEGPSDYLYIEWARHELRRLKRAPLDPRWVIVPAGGIDKIGSFVSLFNGKKLHIAVFTDFASGEKKKLRDIKVSRLLQAGHVFSAEMYAGQGEADIEDIFGRRLYVELVNRCYNLKGKQHLPDARPADAPMRVVKEVEQHFATLPAGAPEFDHYAVAQYLMEHWAEIRDELPEVDKALERFEGFFGDVNKLLPRM